MGEGGSDGEGGSSTEFHSGIGVAGAQTARDGVVTAPPCPHDGVALVDRDVGGLEHKSGAHLDIVGGGLGGTREQQRSGEEGGS